MEIVGVPTGYQVYIDDFEVGSVNTVCPSFPHYFLKMNFTQPVSREVHLHLSHLHRKRVSWDGHKTMPFSCLLISPSAYGRKIWCTVEVSF